MHIVRTLAELEALYGEPVPSSLTKEIDHLTPLHQEYVSASPFVLIATSGAGGLDCSPRGDPAGFVRVPDERTLLLPDRRGNNRIDSLSNLLVDARLALLFLIPGCNETLRVNGHGRLSRSPALCEALAMDGRAPASVLVVRVSSVYFQCGRAVMRSALWDATSRIDRRQLPSVGTVLGTLSQGRIDGGAYDAELPGRQRGTLY